MTDPQGPPHADDPTPWARPGAEPSAPSDSPTTRIRPADTQEFRGYQPPPAPNQPSQHAYPPGPPDPGFAAPTQQFPSETPPPEKPRHGFLRDPLSITLIFVTVLALIGVGVVGAELIARHIAVDKVTKAVECEAKDSASVSFGAMPPFLWQHINGDYTNISIHTAGNQLRTAKGMKADIDIRDVNLHGDANSKGTIGALDATLSWTAAGIKETVQDAIPILGNFISSDVTTNPGDGTVQLKGTLENITIKPQVADGGLSLQVVNFTGVGFTLPRESIQTTIDAFTSRLTKQFPLGIHADSVQVTDDGVIGHLSTRNASIPSGQADACFANL
jgi:hypothetical protein